MSGANRPVPTFDEPVDAEERATLALEEDGGLPEDNPFSEVVEELREAGQTWREIHQAMDNAYDAVDTAAYEESMKLMAEWQVTAVVPDETSTSGKSYKTFSVSADTPDEAEDEVRDKPEVLDVERDETEQVGYFKYS